LLGVLVVIVILVGAVWFSGFNTSGSQLTAANISQSLEGASQANVQINTGVGEIHITALAAGADLIQGTVPQGSGFDIRQEFSASGEVAEYRLWQTGTTAWIFPAPRNRIRWDLQLNPETVQNLDLNLGVGQAELDFKDFSIENLQVETAIGNTYLILPAEGDCQVQVEGAIGKLTVVIPQASGVQLQASSGLGTTNVPDDYIREGSGYRSPNYDQAEYQINLTISNAIGLIEIITEP